MQLKCFLPPTLLSDILEFIVSYLVLYKSLIKIDLTALRMKIPLSFFRINFDPFLGIVVMVATFIKLGISPLIFNLLNIISNDSLRSFPMQFVWNMLLFKPCGSLDLFSLSFCKFRKFALQHGLIQCLLWHMSSCHLASFLKHLVF